MGIVYRARDPRIDRLVALKTLSPEAASGEAAGVVKERFLNEGRAAGRLSHPGIVPVYDADEDPATSIAYLAMEHVEGTDLRSLLRDGLEPARLVELVAEIAAALDHAHERGVIHRDVKPANILVDAAGHVRLTDFGIARLGSSTMTQAGEFLGTPACMAPEQVLSRPVTPATDVFALGVILYEGLTGRRPFQGDSMAATTHAIVSASPTRPSAAREGLTPAFDDVIARALAKAPEDRYPTAGALAKAAAAALARGGAPPIAGAGVAGARARLALVILGAAIAVVCIVLAGGALRGRGSAAGSPTREQAVPIDAPTGRLAVEVSSMRAGILVVKDGGRELGRLRILQNTGRGAKAIKNVMRKESATLPLPSGRRTLTFAWTMDGRTVAREVQADVPESGRLSVKVDVGMRGKDLDVAFE